MRYRIVPLLLGLLLLVGGCQKLNFEKTVNLTSLATKPYIFDAPAYEQKVTVTVAPTNGGVSAYLVKESDQAAVEKTLDLEKEPASSLLLGSKVSKGAAETYTFEATVPAKTSYALILKAGPKSTDVKIKVVGR